MVEAHDQFGGRAPLIDPAHLTQAQQDLYALIAEKWVPWAEKAGFKARLPDGRLLGPFNLLLFSPESGGAFLDLQRVEGETTSLSRRVREVVILSVGAVFQSGYELYAHAAVALQTGLSADTVQALREGRQAAGLSAQEALAQRFAISLSRQRQVERGLFEEAQAAFGNRGIVDMIILAGCYGLVSSLLNVFETPAPEQADT